MAEESAAAKDAQASAQGTGGGNSKAPLFLIILSVVNMLIVAGVGFMLWQGRKKEAAQPSIEQVLQGEHDTQAKENAEPEDIVGQMIPLESFIVNLAGTKGRRIAKVSIELEVKGQFIQDEIDKRKAQIRDIIVILLSSKSFDEVSTKEGKEGLRTEIKDTVNAFLTKGQIMNVYFTELIYN